MKDAGRGCWRRLAISDFARTSAGGTPKKSNKAFYEGGSIPWLLSGEVGKADVTEASNFITEEGLNGSSAKLFPPSSVLVAMYGATAGEAGVLRFEAATNQAVCAILPGEEHVPEYLYYYLLHAKPELVSQAIGNAQPNISQSKIKALVVPLPPLEEQRRIVAVLDEAFEGLARARANAEANLQNARELFESHLENLFSHPRPEWSKRELSEMCQRITVGHVGPMANRYVDSGIPFLRSQNIRPFQIDLTGVKFIDDVFHTELGKSALKPGDVAIVRTGYPGTCAVIPSELSVANCADLVVATPNDLLVPDFLAMLLNSGFGKRLVAGAAVGAAQKHFNVSSAKKAVFPFPPVDEQRQLVSHAQMLKRVTEDLEARSSQKLKDLDDLRQSLLQQAFAGAFT